MEDFASLPIRGELQTGILSVPPSEAIAALAACLRMRTRGETRSTVTTTSNSVTVEKPVPRDEGFRDVAGQMQTTIVVSPAVEETKLVLTTSATLWPTAVDARIGLEDAMRISMRLTDEISLQSLIKEVNALWIVGSSAPHDSNVVVVQDRISLNADLGVACDVIEQHLRELATRQSVEFRSERTPDLSFVTNDRIPPVVGGVEGRSTDVVEVARKEGCVDISITERFDVTSVDGEPGKPLSAVQTALLRDAMQANVAVFLGYAPAIVARGRVVRSSPLSNSGLVFERSLP